MVKISLMPLVIAILVTSMVIGGCAQQATPTPAPPPAAEIPVVSGKQGVDLSSYGRIELDQSYIEVSSFNNPFENKQSLIDGDAETYWHVKFPKETNEAWVVVDLGSEGRLDALAIRPRIGQLDQLWRGDTAILEGSNDKEEWVPQVRLELKPEELNDQDWIAFVLPENIGSYRYYRLFITYPDFLSLGGLELYGEGGIPSEGDIPVVKPE